jgi:hypothetical protein
MYKVIAEFVDRTTGVRWTPARKGDPPVYYDGADVERYTEKGCLEATARKPGRPRKATAPEPETATLPAPE